MQGQMGRPALNKEDLKVKHSGRTHLNVSDEEGTTASTKVRTEAAIQAFEFYRDGKYVDDQASGEEDGSEEEDYNNFELEPLEELLSEQVRFIHS